MEQFHYLGGGVWVQSPFKTNVEHVNRENVGTYFQLISVMDDFQAKSLYGDDNKLHIAYKDPLHSHI